MSTPYHPKKLRRGQLLAKGLRAIGALLGLWPLLLIAALFILPTTPHLLVTYTYEQRGPLKYYRTCDYLGARGWVSFEAGGHCPAVTMIDRRLYGPKAKP